MKVGDRVIHIKEGIGHIEEFFEDEFVVIRWLTPNNEPSCLVILCLLENIQICPKNVVPMKRSKEWWREANEFCALINHAANQLDCE